MTHTVPMADSEGELALGPNPLAGTMAEQFLHTIAGIWHEHPDYSIRQTMDALNSIFSQPQAKPAAFLHTVRVCNGDPGETDEALSFSRDSFPLGDAGLFESLSSIPLYAHPAQEPQAAPVAPNNDEVICPACCSQFRAIPVNVQRLMLDAGFEPPFTHPPQRKLTPQQLDKVIEAYVGGAELEDGEYSAMVTFAAAVERAHGITEAPRVRGDDAEESK